MSKYWNNLFMVTPGHYCAKSNFSADILRIYRVKRGKWESCYGHCMKRESFGSLREARARFGV